MQTKERPTRGPYRIKGELLNTTCATLMIGRKIEISLSERATDGSPMHLGPRYEIFKEGHDNFACGRLLSTVTLSKTDKYSPQCKVFCSCYSHYVKILSTRYVKHFDPKTFRCQNFHWTTLSFEYAAVCFVCVYSIGARFNNADVLSRPTRHYCTEKKFFFVVLSIIINSLYPLKI